MANNIRIKRRAAGGASGAPASLENAELAFNEQDDTLYYGKGAGGVGGSATQVIAIGGPGAFAPLAHVGSGGAVHADAVANGADGFMTGADKAKLDGISAGANAYTHPSNHPASVITQDASNRFVTDVEKAAWNAKQPAGTYATGTGTASGANTGDETLATIRAKLGITTLSGANTGDQTLAGLGGQPLDADLTAIAALVGTTGLLRKTAADTWTLDTAAYSTTTGTVTGVTATAPVVSSGGNTPVISMAAATSSVNGFMSSTYAAKLDGIAAGANAYSHPTGDGNLHVPATSTTNNGRVLTAGATAGSLSWAVPLALASLAPSALGAASVGVATDAARRDHVHAMPTAANVGAMATSHAANAITGFGASTAALGTSSAGSSATVARADHVHALPTLSALGVPTSDVSMNSRKLTGLAEPTAAQDAATKNYVDNVVQGLDAKASVVAATTVAGTLATSFANASVMDGVTLATGERILIKNQAAPAENGIYTVNATGAPTRALDANAWGELTSAFVFVEEGAVNKDIGFICTADAAGTLGTTGVTFAQFSTVGELLAGTGLSKTGNTFAVTPASAGALGGIRVGSGLTIDGAGVLASAGGSDAPMLISVNTSAVAGTSYVMTAALTLTLPASPPVGSVVLFQNASGANCTVSRNGQPIMGLAEDLTLDLSYTSAKLVYVDATQGWLITDISATQVTQTDWPTITNKPTTVAGYGITDAVGITNLAQGTRTTTTVEVTSSTGANATLGAATTTLAGVMSSADKSKLDGVAASANNYAHPTGDGNLHVPANGTGNSGKVLMASGTAGSYNWTTLGLTDLPDAWVKKSARVATTANITLSAVQTIDGVTVSAGDRVLVKNQSTPAQNGIYVVAAGAWTRAIGADQISEMAGATVNVDSGTANGGQVFTTTLKTTDTLGTSAANFYRVVDTGYTIPATQGGTGQTSYAVGDLLYANTTTAVAKLADVAIGNVLLSGGVGVAPSYGKAGLTTHVSGTLPVANGGTGVTTSTGSGSVVLSTSPILVSPALGTPSSGNLANCTFPTLNQNTTGYAAGLVGGLVGQIPYQTAANTTAMLAAGAAGQVLRSNGAAAPSWVSGYLTDSSSLDGGTF